MAVISDGVQNPGAIMRELRLLRREVEQLRNERSLESASIGAGGLAVKGGSVVIYDADGVEQMRLSTDGLSLQGLLQVVGAIAAADEDGDVFRVDARVPEIFMRPELISAVARLVIAEVIRTADVPTFQTTGSTSYTDLATVGPVITDIEISDAGKMLVMVGAQANPSIDTSTGQLNEFAYMSYDIDGPTSRSANDADALVAGFAADPTSGDIAAGTFSNATKVVPEEGLEPGTYTVTAKYKVDATLGGTPSATFGDRRLTVIAF